MDKLSPLGASATPQSEPASAREPKPWDNAPRTDAIWQRHTADAAAATAAEGGDSSKELTHYYEMACHACELERALDRLRAENAALHVALDRIQYAVAQVGHPDYSLKEMLRDMRYAIDAARGENG